MKPGKGKIRETLSSEHERTPETLGIPGFSLKRTGDFDTIAPPCRIGGAIFSVVWDSAPKGGAVCPQGSWWGTGIGWMQHDS